MLRYGFYNNYVDECPKRKEKYDALSEGDKHFYNNVLPFLLMTTGIGHVSKETIPEIVRRNMCFPLLKDISDERFTELLEHFIGFRVNITFETTQEWAERHTHHYGFSDKESICEEQTRFNAWIKEELNEG